MYNSAMQSHISKWTDYRDARKGTYEFRSRTRYAAVADRLFALGLSNRHTVLDVGAGSCQFGRYLRSRGWRGFYAPVDAVLDGVDLDVWTPPRVDYAVAIEVVEHLYEPFRMLAALSLAARHGVVITTPNDEAVDVLLCDPTHVSIVAAPDLTGLHFTVERHTWFGKPDDTLLAWKGHP